MKSTLPTGEMVRGARNFDGPSNVVMTEFEPMSDQKICGVGINFIEDTNRALYVKSLAPGEAAENSGQIQVCNSDILW